MTERTEAGVADLAREVQIVEEVVRGRPVITAINLLLDMADLSPREDLQVLAFCLGYAARQYTKAGGEVEVLAALHELVEKAYEGAKP